MYEMILIINYEIILMHINTIIDIRHRGRIFIRSYIKIASGKNNKDEKG